MPKSTPRVLKPRSKIEKPNVKNKKLKRLKVVKMLAVMATQQTKNTNPTTDHDESNKNNSKEFLATGRTGRRNALPDVFGENALVTTSDLPEKFKKLATGESSQGSSAESEPLKNPNNRTN